MVLNGGSGARSVDALTTVSFGWKDSGSTTGSETVCCRPWLPVTCAISYNLSETQIC